MVTKETVRWMIAALAAFAILLMLAYIRNEPGVGGRVPDPDDVRVVVVKT